MVVNSDAILTRAQPERLDAIGWRDGPALMDSNNFTEGCRTTVEGRVHFNKAGGTMAFGARVDASLRKPGRTESQLRAGLARRFPSLAETDIEHQWNGPHRPHPSRSAQVPVVCPAAPMCSTGSDTQAGALPPPPSVDTSSPPLS